jgi:hypothetical protein
VFEREDRSELCGCPLRLLNNLAKGSKIGCGAFVDRAKKLIAHSYCKRSERFSSPAYTAQLGDNAMVDTCRRTYATAVPQRLRRIRLRLNLRLTRSQGADLASDHGRADAAPINRAAKGSYAWKRYPSQ